MINRALLLLFLLTQTLVTYSFFQDEINDNCAPVTISSYFTDGNPYDAVTNKVNLYIDRRGAIPSQGGINVTLSEGETYCMPVGSTWRLDYSPGRITLDNGAEYTRSGYFLRGGLRGSVVSSSTPSEIVIIYKLIKEADPIEMPTNDGLLTNLIGHYSTGIFDESAAEIVAHDPSTQVLMYTNAANNSLDVLDIANPATPTLSQSIDLSPYGGGINSVSIYNGIAATAIEAETKQDSGSVVFFSTEGEYLGQVKVGALPDMVTFSHDGQYVLVANEGEPNDEYTIDPEGSVSIIDMKNGVDGASVRTVSFSGYNDQIAILRDKGIRIYGPNATVAQDLEPEYIAVTPDNKYAFVSLQENNAMAKIDIRKGEVIDLFSLGLKDHRTEGNGLDASNKTDDIEIKNWPVFGLYQPDAIRTYTAANGKTYVLTANEGDARDYDGYSEETRVKDLTLERYAYPNADELQTNDAIGRMKTTTATGDLNGDGEIDVINVYGGRSFSIWTDDCKLVWDSGDMIEQKLAELVPDYFNSTNDDNDSRKNRSDDKGPEPEAIEVMHLGDKIYALVGLERQGGVMTFDVTDPTDPFYVTYFNNRDFTVDAEDPATGDLGVEDIKFISAANSPNGKPLIVTANEVSGSISIFGMEEMPRTSATKRKKQKSKTSTAQLATTVYPNPTSDQVSVSYSLAKEAKVSIGIYGVAGHQIAQIASATAPKGNHTTTYSIKDLSSGMYFIRVSIDGENEMLPIIKE